MTLDRIDSRILAELQNNARLSNKELAGRIGDQAGLLTPPMGLNVFTVAGVAKDVPLESIYRGILPFLISIFVVVLLMFLLPELATFLPNMMLR